MKKLKSGGTLDRLSELPDSLILKILSSLEMRDVVRTTFLSKRWNDLWTTIPSLCFKSDDIEDNEEEIRNFINQALWLWKGSRIQKFEICFSGHIVRESLYRDMNWWLRFVMEKKVEELYLDLPCDVGLIFLPHFLYECSSIRKLSIVGDCIHHIRGDVHWDQLKSLMIRCSSVIEDVISQVVSGAPQLEIFDLNSLSEGDESLNVRSSSLKKLSIRKERYYGSAVLTIWTPNLETLKISGAAFTKCLLMDVSSLIDATLDFEDGWGVVLGETLRQILPTFQHVEALTLSSGCFQELVVMKGKYWFAPLPNVKLLTLDICRAIKLNEIVGLLEIFPKLNSLDIDIVSWRFKYTAEPLNSEVNTIKSLMMQLKIVEIGWVNYEKSIFQFIEFFLKHATMLEKIVIQKRGGEKSDDVFLAAEKLLSLQRSFPKVELIFCKEKRRHHMFHSEIM